MKKFPKLRENLTTLVDGVNGRLQSLQGRISENVDKMRGHPPQEEGLSENIQTSEEDKKQMSQRETLIPAEEIDINEDDPVLDLTCKKVYDDEVLEELIQRHGNPQKVLELRLSGNSSIKKLPFHIARFDHLLTLELVDNLISEIPWSIVYLTNLQMLNLSCNVILVVPKAVCYLSHLKELNLSANPMSYLPTELLQLKDLQTLIVTDCIYLTSPPMSECLKGVTHIFMHLEARQRRSNLWVDSNSWFPPSDLMVRSLYTLCIETILLYGVDYLQAVTIPNPVKQELEKAEECKQYRLSLAKCSQCKGVFTCKEKFSVHSCKM